MAIFTLEISDAGTGGARGATALPTPPIFFRSVNPISTGEGRLPPPITNGTPKFFSLRHYWKWVEIEKVLRILLAHSESKRLLRDFQKFQTWLSFIHDLLIKSNMQIHI